MEGDLVDVNLMVEVSNAEGDTVDAHDDDTVALFEEVCDCDKVCLDDGVEVFVSDKDVVGDTLLVTVLVPEQVRDGVQLRGLLTEVFVGDILLVNVLVSDEVRDGVKLRVLLLVLVVEDVVDAV